MAPGVPRGTPAVMTMDCSGAANPSRQAMRQARSTMSSKSWASSVTTQCKPQARASRRPVLCTGVSAMIGTLGLSRAARKPVDPELVQLTMAAACSVCTTWRAAAMMASGVVASGSLRWASMIER